MTFYKLHTFFDSQKCCNRQKMWFILKFQQHRPTEREFSRIEVKWMLDYVFFSEIVAIATKKP